MINLMTRSNLVSEHRSHLLHCSLFIGLICLIQYRELNANPIGFDPWICYGIIGTLVLRVISLVPLVNLFGCVVTFLGLTIYDSLSDDRVRLTNPSLSDAPFLCIRVVTKGDYPELVQENVGKNLKACEELGLVNYSVEVVTEKRLDLPKHPNLKMVLVPFGYRTENGSWYKARNLQYSLDINVLNDDDWILHLDEDGICTVDCLKGVVNFARENLYHFGQGYVELDPENVSVFPTKLLNVSRMIMDCGYGKFQFKFWNNCFFGWKGSYMLCKVGAEKIVGFDGGFEGSLTENAFFAMRATEMGYAFGWVDGDMLELGPLTLMDFVRQHCRIIEGVRLCLRCNFAFKTKFSMYFFLISHLSAPIVLLDIILFKICPLPIPITVKVLKGFVLAVNLHGYVFWAMKRFRNDSVVNLVKELSVALFLGFPLKIIVSCFVVFKWISDRGCNIQFKITKKDFKKDI